MIELYQPIVNFGVLVVIAAMYLYQTPKTIEKVTKDTKTSSKGNFRRFRLGVLGRRRLMKGRATRPFT